MKILELEQGSLPWLAYRQKHVMATDSAIILGLNNFKGVHQLWQEKMGFIEPEPANEAMKRGSLLENDARMLLCEQLGTYFLPLVIESDDYPWMGASLDGISSDQSCICEIKCMKLSKHLQVSPDTIDPCHYAQMQHQLACSGTYVAYYTSFHPDAALTVIKVDRNDDYIEEMIDKEKEFYFETMCNMQPTRESFTLKQRVR